MANFIKQIQDTKRPLVITQHGKGVAVLIDVNEFEAMQEKLELLMDVHASLQQIDNGQGLEHTEALNHVLQRVKNGEAEFMKWEDAKSRLRDEFK